MTLAPGLASGRDPRSGRTAEYLGEDPLLAGTLAAASVHGLGDNPDAPVEAVLKHYVANEQELDRTLSSSNVDERTLRELYTLPFEIAIKQSDPGGVMCAFNDVNNIPPAATRSILNDDPARRDRLRRLGGDGLRRPALAGVRPAVAGGRPRPGAEPLAVLDARR